MSVYTLARMQVADFDGTELETTFGSLDDEHAVVQAYDPDTGLVCALAQAEGQAIENTEREAQVQLAMYIRRHR